MEVMRPVDVLGERLIDGLSTLLWLIYEDAVCNVNPPRYPAHELLVMGREKKGDFAFAVQFQHQINDSMRRDTI